MRQLTILIAIIASATCIGLPLVDSVPRCMIVYTDDEYETLKLDIFFPQLPGQVNGEVYQIITTDTETNRGSSDKIANGKYRKQLDLQENHVYRVCFKILANRQVGTIIIDYNAQVEYKYDISEIKIPDNLLKDEDTKTAYTIAEKIQDDLQKYTQFKQRRKEHENQHFEDIVSANKQMTTISYVQLGLIICVGIYQFFMIRKFLVDKQYM